MNKTIIAFMAAIITGGISACALEPVKLSAPDIERGVNVMKAFTDRHSERVFSDKKLSERDLSDLLWAANGINREDGRRTAPSAINKQDVDVYVITSDGAYIYDAAGEMLFPVAEGDFRKLAIGAQQNFPLAPVHLVMVSDVSRFGDIPADKAESMGMIDAAIVSQNISLFCAGCGLATVPRVTMDTDGLRKVLKLSETQIPVINHPVGYPVNSI